jgi:hypothetical protein
MLQDKIDQSAGRTARDKVFNLDDSLRHRIENWAYENYGWHGFDHGSNKLLEDFLSSVCNSATEWEKVKIEDKLLKQSSI